MPVPLIVGKIKESCCYDIAVKIPATSIINLEIFIWLLQRVIFHNRILCATLLQISKLKQMNLTI